MTAKIFDLSLSVSTKLFLKQQISILEWFLKDHVTLKTAVIMLKIQLWSHFKVYSNRKVILNWNIAIIFIYLNSKQFCILNVSKFVDQINAALVMHICAYIHKRRVVAKIIRTLVFSAAKKRVLRQLFLSFAVVCQ